jgi:hypothetical protein
MYRFESVICLICLIVSLFPPSPYLSTSLSPRLFLSPSLHCKGTMRKFETNIPRKGTARHSPNFPIHVSVSDLYIPTIDLLILLQENMWTDPGNILIVHRHMNVTIGTEAAQVPEKEYTNGIFVAMYYFQASIPSPPPSISPLLEVRSREEPICLSGLDGACLLNKNSTQCWNF